MYTVLNNALQVKGKLSLNNGQGSTAFFSDVITQQMATDNSTDPDSMTSLAFNATDKVGNTKQWGHSLSINVEATDLGTSISTNDYLMYFDRVANHYYLMKVLTVGGDRTTGYLAIDGINTAIYELGKQFPVAKTYTQANLETVVKDVYKNSPFSIRIEDDLETVIDYTVAEKTSAQAILQDLQTKYDVDVDSWIELDNSGNISERVLYFGHLGSNNGELIRYGGAKGFENMSAQEVSDNIYTKLYVVGQTDDKDATKGHIASVNNGMDYIVDDEANASLYAIGASQNQPNYLEGTITNTLLSEPRALLTWAQAQIGIFNHPRFNYTVSPMHDQIVGVGDSITVQDFHMKPMILVNSKVIQKSTSFSSPETNTFVLGEFSSIFSDRASKNNMVIEVIKKDVTVVQEAADHAKAQADEAHRQAVTAKEQAIHAQISADGKTTTYTVDSVQDLPDNAVDGNIGWVKLSDGTHMYSYTDGKWVEKINPSMGADISKEVSDAVTQAKSYTATAIEQNNASQQEIMDGIAKSQADLAIKDGDFINKAQAMADKALSDAKANIATVASKSLGTYLVRLLPGTNIFKTTNSTTIQAQVWKAGQDITSTLDNASFSWKLAKDGANAIGLTNNVKNITAKPSDFTNTGTYIVNVIIPVTDTTGTTRNQTFSDSTTIAKVTDGQDGANGQNGATGATGNGISSTTITYAVSASGTNAPTSGYTSTIPTVNKGQFLWQRTVISYTNGTTKNSDVVTYFAKDGLNGVAGMDGGQGMIAQPSKPTSGLVDGFLWLDTSQTYPVYYIYDSSIKDFKIYQFNAKNINADQIKAKFVGTDRLSASEIIADDLHVKSANIDGRLTASQITVSSTNGAQTSLANFNLGEMSQTISDTKNEVNSLGQVNQLVNTEFSPDFAGWSRVDDGYQLAKDIPTLNGSNVVYIKSTNVGYDYLTQYLSLQPNTTFSFSSMMKFKPAGTPDSSSVYFRYSIMFLDAGGANIGMTYGTLNYNIVDWALQSSKNIKSPNGTVRIKIDYYIRGAGEAWLAQPMLVFSDKVGKYVPGSYINNDKIAALQVSIDAITETVNDPTKGIATRVLNAEGQLLSINDPNTGLQRQITDTAQGVRDETTNRIKGDTNTLSSAADFTTRQIGVYDTGLQSQLTQTGNALLATISSTNLVVDSSLLDSAATNSTVNWTEWGLKKWYYSGDVSYNGVQSMGYNQNSLDGDYSYLNSISWSNFSFAGTTLNVSVDVKANTIGSAGTDYLTVYLVEADADMKTVTQTSITGAIKTANSSWVNYRKSITVNSASKNFYLRYQMRGNGNVYVARPYVGVQELIPGGYTAGTNNNNQTILSLFKDNWSIGITDNIGAITSGIVGNASQMSLISKNVTIDSPSTQITGKTWIKSAMIANGAIGTAQIGDAVITSAKIANLDVSKLVGDTITGFNFNVNKSMKIATGGTLTSNVLNMTQNSFSLESPGVSQTRLSVSRYRLTVSNGTFRINSDGGSMSSDSLVARSMPNASTIYSTATAHGEYNINNIYFSTINSSDGGPNEHMSLSSTHMAVLLGGDGFVDQASDYSIVNPQVIETTGTVLADAISGHGSKPMYINAGGTLRLAANDGSGVKVYISNTNVKTDSPIISGNIMLNTGHAIVSNDNGKMFFYGSNGNQIDLGVKSLSQSSLVSLKENISKVIPKQLLSETLRADLRSYNFTGDDITDKHVTPMIDDVNHEMYIPNDWLSPEGTGVDTYSVIGYLIGSVKALQEQITELKANQ